MFGLRGRIIFLAGSVCLIPCVLITAFVYTLVITNSNEMLKSDLESTAQLKAQWIESWCRELIQITEDAAQDSLFQGSPDNQQILAFLRDLKDFWGAETVALVNPSGSSELNTNNYISTFSDAYVKSALAGTLTHGGVSFSTVTSNPIFSVAAPIEVDDQIIGALVMSRNIQKIADEFNQAYGYDSRDSFILNPRGMVITEGRLDKQIRASVLDTPPTQANQTRGSARYVNHLDTETIGAWQASELGWTVVEEVEAAEAMTLVNQRLPLLFIFAGGMVIIALISALIISGKIAIPVSKLALSANRIAEGNLALENKVVVTSKDEVGHLANSFNAMVENLRFLIANVKQSASELGKKSETIKESSGNVASGTSEQANIALEVNQAITELLKASEAIAAGAQEAKESGDSAYNEARASGIAIKEAINSLDAVQEAVSVLGDSSKRIGEILAVINDIADQTNLLALNAAIEAARAGESGKSFAVVAEAVGSLAERAGNSTKEVAALVGETRAQITNAVKISATGADKAGQAIAAMDNINASIETIVGKIGEISAASLQQSESAEKATTSMVNLSTSSEAVSGSAREMAESALILARLGHDLQNLVSNFMNI